jgi:hypothetical protein
MADIQKAPRWLWAILLIFVGLLVIGGLISLIPAPEPTTRKPQPQAQTPAPQPAPEITELACATVVVPAGKIVNTHVFVRPGIRVFFYQPEPRLFYIHGTKVEVPVMSQRHNCTFSNADYIYLRGGPVTTTVTLTK